MNLDDDVTWVFATISNCHGGHMVFSSLFDPRHFVSFGWFRPLPYRYVSHWIAGLLAHRPPSATPKATSVRHQLPTQRSPAALSRLPDLQQRLLACLLARLLASALREYVR